MEISGSTSLSNFNSAFASRKSVYDGVFGGRSKNGGIPFLAPRLDDYSEIFGGFHTYRSSSIPLIHLPLAGDDPKLHFDVRRPGFSYDEVFGEVGGPVSACTASFEDIVRQSSRYDSSGKTWSPVQGVSSSDELGPSAGSEKINKLPVGDCRQIFTSNQQLDSSHGSGSSRKHVDSSFTRNDHVSSFTAAPGCTFSRSDSSVSWIEESDRCPIPVADSIECSKESSGRLREDQPGKKCSPDQEHCRDSKMQSYDSNPSVNQGDYASVQDKPFITVSDISLRTKPSRLPPPSRPPPGLDSKKGECGRSDSKRDVSKDDLFEMMADESELHFLDVEIDSTSCKEDGNDCVGVVCASIEESLEGNGRFSVPVDEQTDICARACSSSEEKVIRSEGEESAVSEPFGEGRINSRKIVHETSKLRGVGLLHPEHIMDKSADSAAWREAAGYFEVSETRISRYPVDDFDGHSPPGTSTYQKETQFHVFSPTGERMQHVFNEKHSDLGKQLHNEKTRCSWSDRNGLSESKMRHRMGNEDDPGKEGRKNFEKIEMMSSGEAKGDIRAMDANAKRKALLGMKKVEERFVAKPILKQSSGKYSILTPRDAGRRRIENVEHAKVRERAGKSKEPQGLVKKQHGDSINKNEQKWKGSNELKEKVVILEWMNGESGDTSSVPSMQEKVRDEQLDHESDIKEVLVHPNEEKVNLLTFDDALHQVINDKRRGPVPRKEAFEEPTVDVSKGEGNQLEISNIIENEDLQKLGDNPKSEPDKVKMPETDNLSHVKEDDLQELTAHTAGNSTTEFARSPKWTDSDIMKGHISSPLGHHVKLEKMYSAEGDSFLKMGGAQLASRRTDSRESWGPYQVTRSSSAKENVVQDASSGLQNSVVTVYSMKTAISQKVDKNYKRINENLAAKDQEVVEPIRSESRLEDELKRKMEEEREREREREKDRRAVRASLDDCERSYTESRESVVAERGASLVRQRTMRETQRSEKASMEARFRAERAAVERATIEARQQATERLRIQKATADGSHVEKPVADRFSASFISTDTGLHLQNAGNWKKSPTSHSPAHDGGKCESPQRYKARLERSQRTADRVANALAEKNKRDLLAQIEREEKNRIAEVLDAEVKRWSNGKEANLRALLSTLQYILGPDSGWQPIPLTEVVTSAAVKRAYRKATLCVHPDKLQQRGATVQQKYISEKVFDLLKEAWNKLNAMEC